LGRSVTAAVGYEASERPRRKSMGAIDRLKEMLIGMSDRLDHMLRRRQEKDDEGASEEESGESSQEGE
jgi:hypothetical protein